MVARKTASERRDEAVSSAEKRVSSAQKRVGVALARVTKVRASAAPAEENYRSAELGLKQALDYLDWAKAMPTGVGGSVSDESDLPVGETMGRTLAVEASVSAFAPDDEDDDEEDEEEYYDDDDEEEEK